MREMCGGFWEVLERRTSAVGVVPFETTSAGIVVVRQEVLAACAEYGVPMAALQHQAQRRDKIQVWSPRLVGAILPLAAWNYEQQKDWIRSCLATLFMLQRQNDWEEVLMPRMGETVGLDWHVHLWPMFEMFENWLIVVSAHTVPISL